MLEKIKWNGNSRVMYQLVISKVPMLFKVKVTRSINAYISENNITEVSEEMIIKAFEEYAPKKYYNILINDLEKLKSN